MEGKFSRGFHHLTKFLLNLLISIFNILPGGNCRTFLNTVLEQLKRVAGTIPKLMSSN